MATSHLAARGGAHVGCSRARSVAHPARASSRGVPRHPRGSPVQLGRHRMGRRPADGPATECGWGGSGGPPPRDVRRCGYAGDGGDGDVEREAGRKTPQQLVPLGYGAFFIAMHVLAKCIVTWCTTDAELAFMAIDLGFLTFLGWFCLMAHFLSLQSLYGFLIECGTAFMVGELIFSGLLVNMIKPELNYKWTSDFLVHHVSSLMMGAVALATFKVSPGLGDISLAMIGTEVTTFLPVAFRQSVKHKRIKDKNVSTLLGVAFPLAFLWRTGWSAMMLKHLVTVVRPAWIMNANPSALFRAFWHAGEVGHAAVVASNVLWTSRVMSGTAKVIMSKTRRRQLSDNAFDKELH